jgi:hypothetical protein
METDGGGRFCFNLVCLFGMDLFLIFVKKEPKPQREERKWIETSIGRRDSELKQALEEEKVNEK